MLADGIRVEDSYRYGIDELTSVGSQSRARGCAPATATADRIYALSAAGLHHVLPTSDADPEGSVLAIAVSSTSVATSRSI